jgi:type IV pilus assembly protein PilV
MVIAMNIMKRSKGISLIEVLVTLVILSFGLLGLAGLQLYSLQTNNSALMRSQATFLVMDMFDRMRLNRKEALDGDYDFNANVNLTSGDDFDATIPTGTSLAEEDVNTWANLVSNTLPDGKGSIDCTNPGNSTCRVIVQWADTRGRYAGGKCATKDPACFVADTRL